MNYQLIRWFQKYWLSITYFRLRKYSCEGVGEWTSLLIGLWAGSGVYSPQDEMRLLWALASLTGPCCGCPWHSGRRFPRTPGKAECFGWVGAEGVQGSIESREAKASHRLRPMLVRLFQQVLLSLLDGETTLREFAQLCNSHLRLWVLRPPAQLTTCKTLSKALGVFESQLTNWAFHVEVTVIVRAQWRYLHCAWYRASTQSSYQLSWWPVTACPSPLVPQILS